MACLVAAAALIPSGQQPQAPATASSKPAARAASAGRVLDLQEIVATLQSPEKAKAKATNDPLLFAWSLFINLNWPARLDVRGMPDPNKPFGGPGPLVWQTWKTSQNLYLQAGERPHPSKQVPISTKPALPTHRIYLQVICGNR